MKRTVLVALAALAIPASAFAVTAAVGDDQPPSRSERMQRWAADRETVLDAKLAGMKAGLQLTADQDKLWTSFETAVKDAAQARMNAMREMMENRADRERMSPIDHLEAMADRLSQGAANVKKIADAAKPLYASLDDSQKHKFATLGRMLMPERPRFAMGMPSRHPMGGPGNGAE